MKLNPLQLLLSQSVKRVMVEGGWLDRWAGSVPSRLVGEASAGLKRSLRPRSNLEH